MSDTPQIELTEEALEAAAQKAIAAFEAAHDLEELTAARREHLGDSGYIPQARQSLGQLPKDQRKDAGRAVNMARGKVEKSFSQIREVLEQQARAAQLKAEKVDVTIPTTRAQTGALHPITALSERIADIFVGMGWEIADGPEVEAEYFNKVGGYRQGYGFRFLVCVYRTHPTRGQRRQTTPRSQPKEG